MRYSTRLGGMGDATWAANPSISPWTDPALADYALIGGFQEDMPPPFNYDGVHWAYKIAYDQTGQMVGRPVPQSPNDRAAFTRYQAYFLDPQAENKILGFIPGGQGVTGRYGLMSTVAYGGASAKGATIVPTQPPSAAPAQVSPLPVASAPPVVSPVYNPRDPAYVTPTITGAGSPSVTAFAMPGASTPNNGIDYSKLVSSYGSGLFSSLFPSAAGSPGSSLINSLTGESPDAGGGAIPGSPGALHASSGLSPMAMLGIGAGILFFLSKKRRR